MDNHGRGRPDAGILRLGQALVFRGADFTVRVPEGFGGFTPHFVERFLADGTLPERAPGSHTGDDGRAIPSARSP